MVDMTPTDEVTNWFKSIKLPQYTDSFLEAGFDDLEVLAHLTDDDLTSLPVNIPLGHRKKILLKARDLGSATLRGHYADGVYIPPPKSLITSEQLAQIKAAEQLARARNKASPFSPKQQEEMRLALKTEVLKDLKNEGFEVDESLRKADADLKAVRAQTDDDTDASESTSLDTKRRKPVTGKKLKRKKNLRSKERAAAKERARSPRVHSPKALSPKQHSNKEHGTATRSRTRSNERLAVAAAAASNKPLPVKVYLPSRPEEPLIFSLYSSNTVHDLVALAARSLDVPAAEFSLRQIDPTGNATRVEGGVKPLQLIASFGADAPLYRFELAPRSKSFVRFYHENDSTKFHQIEVDDETEVGDVLEQIAALLKTSDTSLELLIAHGDKKRALAEYEFVAALVEQSTKRGVEATFLVADRRLSSPRAVRQPSSSSELIDLKSALNLTGAGLGMVSPDGPLSPQRGSADTVVRGPFWNVMQGAVSSSSAHQHVTVRLGQLTEQWPINTRKSLREQLASLAAKFAIADIHNYNIYASDDMARPLNINVPVSFGADVELVLRHRSGATTRINSRASRTKPAPPKAAAPGSDVDQPPAPPASTAPSSSHSTSSTAPRRQPPSKKPPKKRAAAAAAADESSSDEPLPPPPGAHIKPRSILKSGTESDHADVTSDDSKSDRKVSFTQKNNS